MEIKEIYICISHLQGSWWWSWIEFIGCGELMPAFSRALKRSRKERRGYKGREVRKGKGEGRHPNKNIMAIDIRLI